MGIKWTDASCSLYDGCRKKYVHRWSSKKCRYDILFGFETPYEALEFSGKMLHHLRTRYCIQPSKCRSWHAKNTLRANAWRADLSKFLFFAGKTSNFLMS